MVKQTNVLIVGSGGREHAIGVALNASKYVSEVWVSPKNAGLAQLSKAKIFKIDPLEPPYDALVNLCKVKDVFMVVVGPELHLQLGIANFLENESIAVFGPRERAARIETDKLYSKRFMKDNNIPTPKYEYFSMKEKNCLERASNFVQRIWPQRLLPFGSCVIKANNLQGGKGVFVCNTTDEALKSLEQFEISTTSLNVKNLDTIIIEEKLTGYEVSVQAFVDKSGSFLVLPPVQDHKRRCEGDVGRNTGGMGAICPYPLSDEQLENITHNVFNKAINGFRHSGLQFCGILNAGIMIDENGSPWVLEFNCRFGDPEAQAVLPLLKTDLYELMTACCQQNLSKMHLEIEKKFVSAVCVVINSYPDVSESALHCPITGVEVAQKNATVYFAGAYLKDCEYFTSSGRVMTICAKDNTLEDAVWQAVEAASAIKFSVKFLPHRADFRRDIGFVARTTEIMQLNSEMTYANAGVSVQKGNEFVNSIKKQIRDSGGYDDFIGGFGAFFTQDPALPCIVAGTDGVGTKIKIAQEMNNHRTIGQDLVAMCVNDLLACSAEPLFFLDYYACGMLDVDVSADIIRGILDGCHYAKCPLIGGETAELPDMYKADEYDLAGFAVGKLTEVRTFPRKDLMKETSFLVGFRSTGLHSNGFSLVRKMIKQLNLKLDDDAPFDTRQKLGDVLLTPTFIYRPLFTLLNDKKVLGAAHITGGGLPENITRILPDGYTALINRPWVPHNIFLWMLGKGVGFTEMMNTFNMGLGMVLIINGETGKNINTIIAEWENTVLPHPIFQDLNPCLIGELRQTPGEKGVKFDGIENAFLKLAGGLLSRYPQLFPPFFSQKKRVAVLISGTGTNLQALMDHAKGFSSAVITLVISSKATARGIELAKAAYIPTKVICPKQYANRESFEKAMHEELIAAGIEYICLAGFMRILTKWFVGRWAGKMLNIHPSLLPSFKGDNAIEQALKRGVCVTGCTVHFVQTIVDSGKIVAQEAVPILPDDDVSTLAERIKEAEHRIYPLALEDLVKGIVKLE